MNIKPILAANRLGPALTICDGTFPILRLSFIKLHIGLYFTPTKIRIIKSEAEKKMTSLNGVNKYILIERNVIIEYILVNLALTNSADIGQD